MSQATGEAVNKKARMPPAAIQSPIRTQPSKALGDRLFRKQVLPVGRVPYEGRYIDFSPDYLRRLERNFAAGAFDQVPFVLADEDNKHNQKPERFRGDVKGVEFTGDGLDFIVEVTDEGAKLIRDNPKLGVSARIVEEGRGLETPRAVPAIAHVCGTLDPVATRMRDWEAVSDLSTSYPAAQVIDLTAETYEQMPGTDADTNTLTDEQKAALKGANVPEDQYEAVAAIFAKPGEGEGKEAGTRATAEKPEENKDKPTGLRAILAAITGRKPEEFKDEEIAALESGEPAEPKESEVQETALSAEAQRAIDLAASDSAAAKREAEAARAELAETRFQARKTELISKGVPPAMVDLAAPLLKGDDDKVIELSAGDKTSPREIADKLLEQAEGTVDLSSEQGRVASEDDSERAKAVEIVDRWTGKDGKNDG